MSWGQWWYVIKGVGYVRTRRGLVIPGSSRFVNEVKVGGGASQDGGSQVPWRHALLWLLRLLQQHPDL